jgi:hypothetical protein
MRVVERAPVEVAPAPMRAAAPTMLEDLPPVALRDDVDAELEQWKAVRKARKRSFREPWRSAAIVSTIGFGLSSWLLPDSVSTTVDLITGGLAVGSVVVGLRRPRYTPPVATSDPA